MTDIVYILGKGAEKIDNNPLRWSLRSLKFATNIGRVIVAGVIPDWLSDEVVKVPCDTVSRGKELNIHTGEITAVNELAMTEPFLYSSDDHYFLPKKDGSLHDLDKWPRYYSGKMPTQAYLVRKANEEGKLANLWQFSLAQTRAVLEAEKLPVRRTCIHLNTWMDPQDVRSAAEFYKKYKGYSRAGFVNDPVINAFYEKRMNDAGTPPKYVLYKQDSKVKSVKDIQKKLKLGCPQMSTSPDGESDKGVIEWMTLTYGEKCKYEK